MLQKTETPPNFSGGIVILSKQAFQAVLPPRQHGAEGQVDTRALDFAAFHHGVPPVGLGAAAHHDELPVLQHEFALFLCLFVFEGEFPRCAEADGGNYAVFAQTGFVVAVPRHALTAVGVAVEQAGVEADGADGGKLLFYLLFDVG